MVLFVFCDMAFVAEIRHAAKAFFLIAKHNRGLALLLNKNESEALNNFKEIIQIDPDYVSSLYELAKIYRNKKQYDLAIDLCKRVIKIDPNHLDAIYLGIKIRQNINKKSNKCILFPAKIKLIENNT